MADEQFANKRKERKKTRHEKGKIENKDTNALVN